MNTLEKRKLEGIVASKIAGAKEIYKARREAERKMLINKAEENVPTQVQKLGASFVELKKKLKDVEKKAEEFGYSIQCSDGQADFSLDRTSNWVSGSCVYDYSEPSISTHQQETRKGIEAFDELVTDYSVKIWSDSEDMGKLLASFKQDLKAIA